MIIFKNRFMLKLRHISLSIKEQLNICVHLVEKEKLAQTGRNCCVILCKWLIIHSRI